MNKDLTYRFFNALIILVVLAFVIFSCDSGAKEMGPPEYSSEDEVKDTILPTATKERKPELIITYKVDSLTTKTAVDSFKSRFSEEEQNIIFALNRVDRWRLDPGDRLIIPDTLTGNLMDYSPFPNKLEILDSIPKAVLISRRVQAVALYEKGKMINWGPASTGKESTQTPAGLYYGNYKAKRKVSTIDKDWIMPYYFNYMNYEGIGTHIYSLPGYPASHGCVRLREQEAKNIYNWADQWKLNGNKQVVEKNGTPFMVFGEYDYQKPSPWLGMAEDPKGNFLTVSELDTLRAYVDRYFKDDRNFEKTEEMKLSLPSSTEIETIQ
ncbi:MAG TPA: murein L,D-transpeptidase [Salinimicrobium catena]|uniref:Murein L,D-transpeptidase n=1 Tax=Salinimicrobium catena TaxID=390640 RepID=A0A7C2RQ61_9FLAO|nr:murein L,D-transpeptidase [Salinimicrobium catena]